MAVASFSTLLQETKKTYLSRRKDMQFVILLAACFLAVSLIVPTIKEERVEKELEAQIGIPLTQEHMGSLQLMWMKEGVEDDAHIKSILNHLTEKGDTNARETLMAAYKKSRAPFALVEGMFHLLWLFVGPLFYASLVLLSKHSAPKNRADLLKKAAKKIPGFLGVSIVNGLIFSAPFLVTLTAAALLIMYGLPFMPLVLVFFAWLVYIAILGPRLLLAPLLYAHENLGMIASIKRAYVITRGHWAKVVTNSILMAFFLMLCALVVMIIVGVLSAILEITLPRVGMLLMLIVFGLVYSFVCAVGVIFLTKLTETLIANPRKK